MSSSAFDTSPAEALRAIDMHRGAVLVDLDETLYLRNSTEDFIGSAWPGPLAFLLVKLLDLLRPWLLTGGARTRDVWRVATICILMPWSLWAWRRRAQRLGREYANRQLVASLQACRQPKAVVTLGFLPIVGPLVAAMGLHDTRLVAMSPWRFRDRLEGKQALVVKALGAQEVRGALLVTDSLDDLDLLHECLCPLRVIWPEARFREAFHDIYLPGLYTSRVKRPGLKYIYRGVISDEYSVWVLASLPLAMQPLPHVIGLALLSVSFWAIYETGYVHNDLIGSRHEKDPKLTRQFYESPVRISAVLPWVWAAACGMVALLLLRWPLPPTAWDLLAWSMVLVLTFFWFRIYNLMDKRTRIWLFAGLQAFRSLSFVAVVSVTVVGAIALIAHVLARWVPYYAYRVSGTEYNDEEVGSSRLLFFVLISGGLALTVGWEPFLTPSAAILLLWFGFKARRELARSYRRAHLITSRKPPTGNVKTGQAPAHRTAG
jgi:hypothetical protein